MRNMRRGINTIGTLSEGMGSGTLLGMVTNIQQSKLINKLIQS